MFTDYGFYGVKCLTKTKKNQEFNVEIQREVETNEVTGNISSTLLNSAEYGK